MPPGTPQKVCAFTVDPFGCLLSLDQRDLFKGKSHHVIPYFKTSVGAPVPPNPSL